MLTLTEFSKELHEKYLREDAREEGLAEGRAEGREQGRAEGRAEGAMATLFSLVRKGLLIIEDKEFLVEVGLAEEENIMAIELTPALKEKCISTMPVWELEKTLGQLSEYQISELAEYAIANHTKMKMDRIELLNKASHKNILKAIELYKAAQED